MRLTQKEVESIVQAIASNLSNQHAQLRLFGSRTDPTLKGGDIDLLLLVENENSRSKLVSKKHYLLADIKAAIGEQKIDLKIASLAELKSDPFLKAIYSKSILIKDFN